MWFDLQFRIGKWESTQFNSRLQPTQIALGVTQGATNLLKLDYSYGSTQNNSNVLSQTITVPTVGTNQGFTAVQSYFYDSLNRLKSAVENVTPHGGTAVQSWKQTFTFDRYGNHRFETANGSTTTLDPNCPEAICNPTISTANNRLSSTGWQYDAAGNTTADPEGRTFIYDGENKQTEVRDQYNTVIGQYFFDGDEKRVKKIVPGTGEVTIFVYDAGAKLIAEYSTVVESVENAKVNYLTTDYLGSSRTNTDESGNVTARHDYYPFGQEISTPQRTTGLDTVRRRFTVYQRDEESPDLDYANLRRYSNHIGRFYSADPVAPDIYSPATHNRFQYCLNNPLRFIDSGGGYEEDVHRDLTAALAVVVGFSEAQGNVIGNANQWLDDPESGLGAMPTDSLLDFGYRNRVNWHFTTEGRRYHLWGQFEGIAMRGSGDAALAALGTYLHAQQDSFSHEGFNALLGQGTALPDNWDWQHPLDSLKKAYDEMAKYDKTTFDPEKAVRMARDTLAKLLAARNALVASGRLTALRRPIPWENDRFINDKLLEWAKTEGRNEKRQILFEIMRYAVNYGKPAGASGQLKRRKKKTKTEVKVLDDE